MIDGAQLLPGIDSPGQTTQKPPTYDCKNVKESQLLCFPAIYQFFAFFTIIVVG
jgi:hypothetical protein